MQTFGKPQFIAQHPRRIALLSLQPPLVP